MDDIDKVRQELSEANTKIIQLERELRVRKQIMDNEPFCPDHRDKVSGLPCRECEVERLSMALRRIRDNLYVWGKDSIEDYVTSHLERRT